MNETEGGHRWTSRPVVWLAVCWVAGYAIAIEWGGLSRFSLYMTLAGPALLALTAAWRLPGRLTLALAALLLVCTAAGWYGMFDNRNRSLIPGTWAEEASEGAALAGRIETPVEVDGDKVMFQVGADRIMLPPAAPSSGQKDSSPEELALRGERIQLSIRLLKEDEQREARTWQRGDRIELRGMLERPGEPRNFGSFDYRNYLLRQHIHWQVAVKGLEEVQVSQPGRSEWGWWRLARSNDNLRFTLGAMVDRLFPAEQAGFMKGMLIGLTAELDPQQFDAFSRLGLTHIIAISGLNVAIFLGCVIWSLRRLGMTKEAYLWTAMALLPLYIAITGAAPSIMRAGLMAMIGLYAAYRNRLKDGLHLVMIVGLLMLLWNPYYITDVSFQLSFLVTLGIIVLVPRVSAILPLSNRKWRDALSITLVAQFVSFPLTIYYFNQFSLLSFAANLALVPVFSSFTMPVGTIAMLVGFLLPAAGGWLAWPVAKVNSWLFAIVEWSGELPGFQTIWPTPPLFWIAAYYGLLTAAIASLGLLRRGRDPAENGEGPMLDTWRAMRRKQLLAAWNRVLLLPGAVCLFVVVLMLGYRPALQSPPQGTVQMLDVGQGDSILIRTGGSGGHTVLVDGGGTVTFRKPGEEWKLRHDPYEVGRKLLVPLLKRRGVQQIDEVILTHQDADHFGGLQAVLEQIPVKRLLFNGTLKTIPAVETLFRTALDRGTQLVPIQAGDRLTTREGLELYFLYPIGMGEDRRQLQLAAEQNPISVVFLMELAGTRWLFTGDMGAAEERELLARWRGAVSASSDAGLPALLMEKPLDVLKIAHHGSKSSTSEAWLEAWRPRTALISAGARNVYGHPSPQVTERLNSRGITTYRTDRDGEIQLQVREGKVEIRTMLGVP
ncbi:competence protein ComEC [Paenibacillus sp. UNCCL117]|uniref:DNA internalization-related competence protein ComEC/Rec2 n=1 Tax=unclassified Paenibacillus TaxID=185978 RepID=UPI0008891C52|nr:MULTISPECIES: DNA internalization-related competence protein ComEC/Rec2 [unclassified Paenibacillus]SDC70728.1 competence protein ComEC [Paenibacillus sp. cl123]SFW24281.1 competence protein ComEC [Paenibacillus sp. UNCCL117]